MKLRFPFQPKPPASNRRVDVTVILVMIAASIFLATLSAKAQTAAKKHMPVAPEPQATPELTALALEGYAVSLEDWCRRYQDTFSPAEIATVREQARTARATAFNLRYRGAA